jgi:hypothetical protein
MKLVGLNTLMRVLTVLKTRLVVFCREQWSVQRRTIPRSASRVPTNHKFSVTRHGRPPVLLFACLHRHERGSDIS